MVVNPINTPFAARSFPAAYIAFYKRYKFLVDYVVERTVAAPNFLQPGGATQYRIVGIDLKKMVVEGDSSTFDNSITYRALIDNGTIEDLGQTVFSNVGVNVPAPC